MDNFIDECFAYSVKFWEEWELRQHIVELSSVDGFLISELKYLEKQWKNSHTPLLSLAKTNSKIKEGDILAANPDGTVDRFEG